MRTLTLFSPAARPWRTLRRFYYRAKLRMVQAELADVAEDIADARLEARQLRDHANRVLVGIVQDDRDASAIYDEARDRALDTEALIVFYAQLQRERNQLRAALAQLS